MDIIGCRFHEVIDQQKAHGESSYSLQRESLKH